MEDNLQASIFVFSSQNYFRLSFFWKNELLTFAFVVLHEMIPQPGIPGLCVGTVITTGLAVVLFLNLALWLNLNYLLFKRGKAAVTNPPKKRRLLEEIVEEITDPLWIIIVSCFSWITDRIRCVSKK